VPNPKFKCQILNPKLFWIWVASITQGTIACNIQYFFIVSRIWYLKTCYITNNFSKTKRKKQKKKEIETSIIKTPKSAANLRKMPSSIRPYKKYLYLKYN
jgi:hypothetical protein